jgi:four helix bundle protein
VCELETQIKVSGDLGYLNENQLLKLQKGVGEIERMLQALIKSLENKPLKP